MLVVFMVTEAFPSLLRQPAPYRALLGCSCPGCPSDFVSDQAVVLRELVPRRVAERELRGGERHEGAGAQDVTGK